MSDKTDVKVGDKVRVTFEGVVTHADAGAFGTEHGHYFSRSPGRPGQRGGRTVEILERAKPKVGDTVEGKDSLLALPHGTVMNDGMVRVEGGWLYPDRPSHIIPDQYVCRTVAYLPE